MTIDENVIRILLAIAAIIGAGSLITITYKVINKKKNSDNETTINQNNNKVSNGDIIGGNKTVNK